MKSHISLCILFIQSLNTFSLNTISINDAMKSKQINYTATANKNGTHYLGPIILTLTITENKELDIKINAGDIFIPTESKYQNIVITKRENIHLKPNGKSVIVLQGCCTESHDLGASATTVYLLGDNNDITLRKLAQYIDSSKFLGSGEQFAIWTLMNNEDYNNITSSDTIEELKLRKFVAKLQNKEFLLRKNTYHNNYYYSPPSDSRIRGFFEIPAQIKDNIQIAMFDENNILIRELYNSKNQPSNDNRIIYQFDGSVYKNDIYYFKLIVNYEVKLNKKFNIKDIREQYGNKIQNYFLNQMFTGFGF